MNTQLNTHHICESLAMPVSQVILPAVIEETAKRIFEGFSEKMKEALNGRQDRAVKLAVEGHVTHKAGRVFNVRSEDDRHSYLVNLESNFCTCPDSLKGRPCKHRLAAYLVEQAMLVSSVPVDPAPGSVAPEPEASSPRSQLPVTHDEDAVARARCVLEARSQELRDAIIYAKLLLDEQFLGVEIISLDGDLALVRALPTVQNNELVPLFPFPEKQAAALVLAKSLVDVRIYR